MGLKIIGAGLGRTGTASLKVALERLVSENCYHFGEVMANPEYTNYWLDATRGDPDWDKIFKGFDAAVDCPTCLFWDELSEVYPDAKVILTTRDADNWFDSVNTTIHSPGVGEHMSKSPLNDFYFEVLLRDFGKQAYNRDFMTDYFEKRSQQVIDSLPSERLLVYEVKQGWQTLCDFLDVPVPDEPFPRVNTREETQQMLNMILSEDVSKVVDKDLNNQTSKMFYEKG